MPHTKLIQAALDGRELSGVKGRGEGGAIPPPATIANAVNDALRDYGVEVNETPISPRRLRAHIAAKS